MILKITGNLFMKTFLKEFFIINGKFISIPKFKEFLFIYFNCDKTERFILQPDETQKFGRFS